MGGHACVRFRLLAIGLERFGRRGLAKVHEHYLPTKTFNQVHNRYKHLTLASTTWNPVKVPTHPPTGPPTLQPSPMHWAISPCLSLCGVSSLCQ